jgi:hypothetical protein
MSTSLAYTLAILAGLVSQGLVYAGIAFVNQQLLPRLLAPVYTHVGETARVAIIMLLAAVPANYLLSYIYRIIDGSQALMVILATLVFVLAVKSMLIGDGGVSWRVMLACSGTAAMLAWLVYELHAAA